MRNLPPAQDPAGGEERPSLLALQDLVSEMAAPVLLVDLAARRLTFANQAAARLLGADWPVSDNLLQRDFREFVGEAEAERIDQALTALEQGVIRSYEGDRRYPNLKGEPIRAHHFVSRLDLCDAPPAGIAIISPKADGAAEDGPSVDDDTPVLATLGHDWRFEGISPQAETTLGISSRELPGTALLAAVHPDDAGGLLVAVGRSLDDGPTPTAVRVHTKDGWRLANLSVGPLCQHRPPQMAMLISPARSTPDEEKREKARLHALERHVRRIAREIEASGVGVFQPVHARPTPMPDMSTQQQEVVSRLLRGENIGQMAEAMHLSRSTVRNHLSAIYRKLGVHSQTELIAQVTGRLEASTEQ